MKPFIEEQSIEYEESKSEKSGSNSPESVQESESDAEISITKIAYLNMVLSHALFTDDKVNFKKHVVQLDDHLNKKDGEE